MTDYLKRHVWLVIFAGFMVGSLGMGIRQNFGQFLPAMTADLGFGRQTFGFAMALQNVLWGIFTPFVGAVADKYGSGRMIALGGAVYAAGLYVMANAETAFGVNMGAGVLIGFGQAATGFSVVLAAVARKVSPAKRSIALGITSAGGSFGQFYMAPISQGFLEAYGWSTALIFIAGLSAIMVLLATALTGNSSETSEGDPTQTISDAIREASRHKDYWFLSAGFFVCGFQVAFVAVHLPAFLQDLNFTATVGATAIGLIGLFNVIGTYSCGVLGGRYSKKYLLSTLYLLRSITIALFLVVPPTEFTVYVFASALGLLWLGTVPLTSGLVALIFGVRYMGTLFGGVFFTHQLGSFIGVWWGGYAFDTTGSYDNVWIASIILGVAAAVLHMPIVERAIRPLQQET
ncbi:MAG: MFS transporter [Rhodospirillales bacterium]|nr:MFS transporter [Alphaproteobacteria bacterium]MBL6948458.1 MFS transporter [Rhodospirillales bacterium]